MWETVIAGSFSVRDVVPGDNGAWVIGPTQCFFVSLEPRTVASIYHLYGEQKPIGVVGDVLFVSRPDRAEIVAIYPDGHSDSVAVCLSDFTPAAASAYLHEALGPERIRVPGVGEVYLYCAPHKKERMLVGEKIAALWKGGGQYVTFFFKEGGKISIRLLEWLALVERVVIGKDVAMIKRSDGCVILSPGDYARIHTHRLGAVNGNKIAVYHGPGSCIFCWSWDQPQRYSEVPVDFDRVVDLYLVGQQIWVEGTRGRKEGIFSTPFPEPDKEGVWHQTEGEEE